MIVTRVERHLIKKSNLMWETIDQYCFFSKNLYNSANYIVRQEFINNGKWIRYCDLDKIMQETDEYKLFGSQVSQNTLSRLDKNWSSFFRGIKIWSKEKGNGFFGKPSLPGYKNKNGRSLLMIKNIQCKIENGLLIFSWKPLKEFSGIKTNIVGKLMQVRFVPSGGCYIMEIVYQTEVSELIVSKNRIVGIDLGVNNFVTISNNIGELSIIINGKNIKSMNQYYNKTKFKIQEETGNLWNNRLQNLTDKHQRKLDHFMHCASKAIIKYCKYFDIDTVIVGKNNGWKDGINIGKVNNQNFVNIPYESFITKLKYKCENGGISLIETEESYTSGTSFLDNELPIQENYNKKRRKKRGLFKSNSGILINADLNGAYQIIKKVFPNFEWDRGCSLHPVRLNV